MQATTTTAAISSAVPTSTTTLFIRNWVEVKKNCELILDQSRIFAAPNINVEVA